MTGLEFSNVFDLKIDKAYSGFLNPTKKNRLFKEAIVLSIETKYKELESQKSYDEITNLIKTNLTVVPVSNQVTVGVVGSLIADYQHLLAIKSRFAIPYVGIVVSDASNTLPIVITLSNFSDLRSGESVVISGVIGNFAANGTFYVKQLSRKKYQLFSDANLTLPVQGNGAYIQGGIISKIQYNYCKPFYAETKISPLGQPDFANPKYEITQGLIKLYPDNISCSEVTVDYIKKTTVFIISNDNTIDLELTYPVKFLYYIADVSAQLFAESVKDAELFQTSDFEIKTND